MSGIIGCVLLAARPATAGERTYRVTIKSRPEGAKISNDAGTSLGTTPFNGRLPAGSQTLTFQRDGYQTNIQVVEVRHSRRRQRFFVKLEKLKYGKIDVTLATAAGAAKVDKADVIVDGKQVGTAPGTIDVPVGPHQIEVVADGYRKFESWIQVDNHTLQVAATLSAKAGQSSAQTTTDAPIATVHGKPSPPSARRRGPLAVVSAGLEVGGRSFSYDNARTANLRPYDASGVPLVRVNAELFPIASSSNKWLRRLAVTADVARAAPLQSSTDSGQKVDTAWTELSAGLRAGMPLSDSTELRVNVGYGLCDFNFSNAGMLADQIPDVSYRYGRFGAGVATRTGVYRFFGGASYLAVSSAGALASRFSRSSVSGVSANVGATRRLTHAFDLQVGARYTRYSYGITSQQGDTYAADGGTDQFFGLSVGAAYHY